MLKRKVGLITSSVGKAGMTPVLDICYILDRIEGCNFKVLITGGFGYNYFNNRSDLSVYNIIHSVNNSFILRCLKNYFYNHLKMTYIIISLRNDVDIWIFFKGGELLLVPIFISNLLNKKTIIIFTGNASESTKATKGIYMSFPLQFVSRISCKLADRLVLYSQNLIEDWGFEKYKTKISIAPQNIINFNEFKITTKLNQRERIVGYVGRFSNEKGILNFMEALPSILENDSSIRFLIIGSGSSEIEKKIHSYINSNSLSNKVDILNWVSHDELYVYLNKLKLIVLPSSTEGLPNIILEAMACGTPVLATPVGSIPSIILDERTGFIMKDNSPECISSNIIRAMNFQSLEEISKSGREFVENRFTSKNAIALYSDMFENIK